MLKPLKINSLKQNSYKQIAEFDINLFILENWKRLSCRESFTWKNYPWFIRITSFFKIWYETIRKKVRVKIKFVNCIIIFCFKFFPWKLISFLSNDLFNNNISVLESKIIYFCLTSNFRGLTTLRNVYINTGDLPI